MWWLIIIGIVIGALLTFLYFRGRIELMARTLGEEIGKRIFEEKRKNWKNFLKRSIV